jgi:pyridoxine kinase
VPSVIAMSSFVAAGSVGLRAAHAVFDRSAFNLISIPTVLLSAHPGHRHSHQTEIAADDVQAIVASLDDDGRLADVAGVLIGYLPTAAHVAVAHDLICQVKVQNPSAAVLVDPILGDHPGGLYVAEAAANAIRDSLIPVAEILTPNRFELEFLSVRPVANPDDAVAAARSLARPWTIVTSVPAERPDRARDLATLSIATSHIAIHRTQQLPHAPHGTGDLLAALCLQAALTGTSHDDALAVVASIIRRSIQRSGMALDLDFASLDDRHPDDISALP